MSDALTKRAQVLLKDHHVQEVENEGMDDGRFFVHLKEGYAFTWDPHNDLTSKSFGSVKEAKFWLKRVKEL